MSYPYAITASFTGKVKVDLEGWEWEEIAKLEPKTQSLVLKEVSEAVEATIRSQTDATLDILGPEDKLVLRVDVPLGHSEGADLVGHVPFASAVDDLIEAHSRDSLIAAAAQLEAGAKKLREAAGLDGVADEIEHHASGSSLVARLVIDGEERSAPLTKTFNGYEVTIPAPGVLKLPVIIEQQKGLPPTTS